MKTPAAATEENPDRVISLEMHLAEVMNLEQVVQYYIRHAPRGFDCAPNGFKLREVVKLLRDSISNADKEYAESFFKEDEKVIAVMDPTKRVIEIHHHHWYKERPKLDYRIRG